MAEAATSKTLIERLGEEAEHDRVEGGFAGGLLTEAAAKLSRLQSERDEVQSCFEQMCVTARRAGERAEKTESELAEEKAARERADMDSSEWQSTAEQYKQTVASLRAQLEEQSNA